MNLVEEVGGVEGGEAERRVVQHAHQGARVALFEEVVSHAARRALHARDGHARVSYRLRERESTFNSTLEATQGKILSQSPTDTTSGR